MHSQSFNNCEWVKRVEGDLEMRIIYKGRALFTNDCQEREGRADTS